MKKLFIVLAAMLILMSTAAFADTVTITSVNAGTGVVTFQVQNTSAIHDVTNAISGFFFNCTGCTGASTTGQNTGTGLTFNIAGDGSMTATSPATTTNAGWAVTSTSTNFFYSIFNGGSAPKYTIVSNNIASDCNNSVCGNVAHNPFFVTSNNFITFSLHFTNVGNLAQGQTGTLWYGTLAPEGPPPPPVPEPASMFLLGTGLVGLGGAVRRKIRL